MRMKTRPCSKRGQSWAMIKSRAPPPPIQESHSQMKPQHWGRAAEIPIGGAQGKVKLCQNAYIVNFFLHCEVVSLHCYILTHHSFLGNIFTRILIRAPGIKIWDLSSPLQKNCIRLLRAGKSFDLMLGCWTQCWTMAAPGDGKGPKVCTRVILSVDTRKQKWIHNNHQHAEVCTRVTLIELNVEPFIT